MLLPWPLQRFAMIFYRWVQAFVTLDLISKMPTAKNLRSGVAT